MQRITFALAAVAALCMVIAVPTASAAKRSKTDKAQNKALKSYGKAIKKQRAAQRRHAASLKKQNAAVNTLTNSAKSLNGALNDLKTIADRADKTAAGITAGVPAIVKGLTDLRTGLLAAGAGLTSLRTLATSTEYGIGQVYIAGAAAPTAFVETPNIPDEAQQAQTSQRFIAGTAGAVTVRVGVRSNESDGVQGGAAAAHCRVTVNDGTNTGTSTAPQNPVDSVVGAAPFYAIPLKSPQTSTTETSFGFGQISTDNVVDLSQAGVNSTNVPGAPTVAIGQSYEVSLSCIDATPSATDPSA
ncbi:MAG TPA: hypothetical protein VEX39_12525 [Thermoleophilaceae bacterium]|nr:hypothetical protein [Thermoleophilaceae bacterium]